MKRLTILLLAFIILFTVGCKKENESANALNLSNEDSLKIAQEIDSVINGYTNAHNEMNAAKAAEYFINSPEMLVLENGERYANWETLANFIKDFYSTTVSAKITWTEKKILVLSPASSIMTGKFTFESLSKDKKKYASTGWATILIIKQNNQWKFHQYHESYKILTK